MTDIKVLFLTQAAYPLIVRGLCSLDSGTQAAGAATNLEMNSLYGKETQSSVSHLSQK